MKDIKQQVVKEVYDFGLDLADWIAEHKASTDNGVV